MAKAPKKAARKAIKPIKPKTLAGNASKEKAKQKISFLAAATRAQKEARARLREGIDQRARSGILISPDEVAGEYDMSRALVTSLGGTGLRAITVDDLKTFRAVVRDLGKKFKGGITAKQVIDLSLPAARKRALEQIHTAVPFYHKGGRIQFQTNAGPESKAKRHVVTVEFMNFEACVASPVEPRKIVPQLIKGKIKLDCDCEDWRYRLRYIATTGKYAAGPWFENSFPKITNPMLLGVGCKHVIRVCTVIAQSPNFKEYAARLITKSRDDVERKEGRLRAKEMRELAAKMTKESSRQRAIKTTEEKRAQRAAQPAHQRREAERLAKMAATAKKREQARRQKAARNAEKAFRDAKRNADNLLSQGVIDREMYDMIISKAQRMKDGAQSNRTN